MGPRVIESMIANGDAFRWVLGEPGLACKVRDRSVITGGVLGLDNLGLVWKVRDGASIASDHGR